MYPFERFDGGAKAALAASQQAAERDGHHYIGTEHVLLGLLQPGTGSASLLRGLGVQEATVQETIRNVLGRPAERPGPQIVPTARVGRTLELAFAAAARESSPLVTSEHLLVGLLEEGSGIAAHVLGDLGITLGAVQAARGGAGT